LIISRFSLRTAAKEASERPLADTRTQISDTQNTFADTQTPFADTQSTFADTQSTFADAQSAFADTQTSIADTQFRFADTRTQISDALTAFADARTQISDAQSWFADTPTGISLTPAWFAATPTAGGAGADFFNHEIHQTPESSSKMNRVLIFVWFGYFVVNSGGRFDFPPQFGFPAEQIGLSWVKSCQRKTSCLN